MSSKKVIDKKVKTPGTPNPKGKFVPGAFKLKVKRSSAGLGLYAMEPIPKGKCVIEYIGKRIGLEEEERTENQYLFDVPGYETINGFPRYNTARYINHSHRPNCEAELHLGRVFIMAKRNIKAGEELAYNYGKEFVNEYIKPKGCKCVKCSPELHMHNN